MKFEFFIFFMKIDVKLLLSYAYNHKILDLDGRVINSGTHMYNQKKKLANKILKVHVGFKVKNQIYKRGKFTL